MLKPIAWIAAAVLSSPLLVAAAPPGAPDGLLCELLRWPERTVVSNPRPHLGWIVNDSARGAVQSAYQIMVWAEPHNQDAETLWDSGKVMSANSVDVQYAGKPLALNHSYVWAVRTWNAAGEASPWSTTQRINFGEAGGARSWPRESKWVMFTARDLLAGDVRNGLIDFRYRIDAEDEEGAIVYTLAFKHALNIIPEPI